jgi:hypothetical protein
MSYYSYGNRIYSINEAKDDKKKLQRQLDKETTEKYRYLWKERNKTICPHCGQPYDEKEAKKGRM